MKRVFWILITPLAGFLVLWLILSMYVGPKLETWALAQIESYSDSSLPVRIRAQNLHLKLFKPSLSLEGIEVEGKGELAESLQTLRIGSVRVFVDFFHLLSGRVTLSAVVVDSPDVEINIDPFLKDDSPPKELPMDAIFAQLEKLPLQRIFLQNIHLKVVSKKEKLSVEIQDGDILTTNMGKNLTTKADIPHVQFSMAGVGNFEGSLDTHLYLTRQSLRILQLGVRFDNSEILARGELTRFSEIAIKPSGLIDLSGKIHLGDIYNEIKKSRPQMKFPALAGDVNLEAETRFDGLDNIRSKVDITTKALNIDQFSLGDARIQGEYKDRNITLSEMKVQHPAGEAVVTKAQMTLDGNYAFKTKISLKSLDLQKLFHSLNLHEIPVGLQAQGEIPCEGQIRPELQVTCTNASISGKDLWVKAGMKAQDTIVNVDSMSAQGQVHVTMKSLNYSADLALGSNTGSSDGVIDFEKGFKINFKTKKLEMKNIKNLAHLKMEGSASIEGMTSGDSHAAIFDMKLNARDFVFEDFALGNLITDLKYRDGSLLFQDIAGAVNKTQYLGGLTVNLRNNTLTGEFSAPTADLNDIALVFERIYKLPVDVQGVGAAKARVSGPLNFWKMNYHLESAFKNLNIGAENFELLNFNVTAQNGNLKTDNVSLKRGNGTLVLQGGISSEQVMNLYADGKNWRLEESDIISKINTSIIGNLNFAAELKDSVRTPQITIKGAATDTLFEEQEIPNSNFILHINRESFGAQLSLFGDKVQGEFQLPFAKGKAPLIMKIKTNNWNYSSVLGLIGGSNLVNEYDSSLTSSVDLRSETGEALKSTGKIHVQNFSLKRGTLSFANRSPMDITMDNGLINIKNFELEGPNTTIKIRGENFTSERLNVSVNAQADMRLLQIFTPFLDDIGGALNLSTTVSGPLRKPEVLGNLNTSNAFVKLKGFPHPIERLSMEVVFSQSRVMINSIRGQIAGGTLTGDGGITINGIRDLPTSIRLHMENVTFNVPDKVRSNGNADLLFSGRWFPFTLSGTFRVNNALVEKEFTEDGGGVSGVKQSRYLPKVIRETHFEPILFDLQLLMDRNIIVKNSLIDGSVTGQLQVRGSPSAPVLLGKITLEKKSRLIFKDKIFDVQNGIIDLNDPNEINPNLYITAQSRIDTYDITLLAQGPAKNMTIRLTSIPPLPEQDIISLIALGITSTNMNQVQSRQQADQLGAEIGGAVLAKPINKQLESTLGLNLQVTSQYDSTRNISVPKVTLSRRVSDRVKVSGSRPVRDSQSYDFKLEYLINSNWTAIGSFENVSNEENSAVQTTQQPSESFFGLDLEFKREFK